MSYDVDPYSPIPSLDNYDEMAKVITIPTATTLGPYVRCGGIVAMESFVAVNNFGWIIPFLGCPVHRDDNWKIVGKTREKGGRFGDIISIDMQFNIRTADCTCEVSDIEV